MGKFQSGFLKKHIAVPGCILLPENKWVIFGYFGGTKNGTSGARIKILRPLFNTNTPLKPPLRHFGNHFGPRKSDFWPFYFFGHFPIEIPIEAEKFLSPWEGVELERKQNVF